MSEVGPDYFYSPTKRRLDVIGGTLIALGATVPAGVTAAVTIAEHGPRNLFFRQLRRASRDEEFIVKKFTTFENSVDDIDGRDTPPLLQEYFTEGIDDIDWLLHELDDETTSERIKAEQHGLVNARCSWLGNCIRIAALDELPQAFSIVMGDTSLTGPRAQTDMVLESRLRAAPTLFNDWFTEFYEPFKKGWASPGANWFHRTVPAQALTPTEIITGVMERDLAWVPDADLAYDIRLLADAPFSIVNGLRHHLLSSRSARPIAETE